MAGPCHIGAMRRDDGADDEARAAVAALGRRGRTTRIPDSVRRRVVAYARRRRAAGDSWARIARLVGVSVGSPVGSLQNWSRTPPPARTPVPGDVTAGAEARPAALGVRPPGG